MCCTSGPSLIRVFFQFSHLGLLDLVRLWRIRYGGPKEIGWGYLECYVFDILDMLSSTSLKFTMHVLLRGPPPPPNTKKIKYVQYNETKTD